MHAKDASEDEFVWLLALLALRPKSGSRLVLTLATVCMYTCKCDGIVWASGRGLIGVVNEIELFAENLAETR